MAAVVDPRGPSLNGPNSKSDNVKQSTLPSENIKPIENNNQPVESSSANSNTDAKENTNGNGNAKENANVNAKENTNSNGNSNANTNANAKENANANGNANANTNSNANANAKENTNANGNANANAKENTNANRNAKKNANANGNLNATTNNTEKPSTKPFFHITQKEFWNGPNASYSIMQFLSAFPLTGLLGLDHYYLRSPLSGLLKMIINVLTFGMWYLYDAAQIFGEEELVRKNGLSYPLIGSLGLGAGIFTGGAKEKSNNTQSGGGDQNPPSPLMFLLYCICVLVPLPFALDHFIVGDTKGGIMKLIMNFGVGFPLIFFGGFFLIFFAIFWGLISAFRLYFQTEDILNQGIVRVFPATIFMDKYFCTKLGPDPNCGGEAEDSKGFLSVIIDSLKSFAGSFNQIPIVGTFAGAATKAATAVASTAATTATGLVTAGTTAATLVPKVGSEVIQEANKLGNANQYIPPKKQSGGSATTEDATGPIIFIALAVTAAIGVFMAKFRNLDTIDVLPRSVPTLIRSFIGTKRSFFPSADDDAPPVPGAI